MKKQTTTYMNLEAVVHRYKAARLGDMPFVLFLKRFKYMGDGVFKIKERA